MTAEPPEGTTFDEGAFISQAQDLVRTSDGQRRPPLDMQRALARLLAERKRVIAVQPTGSGKTLAAALPFATQMMGPTQPGQMVFMTPMRSLTSAQAKTLADSLNPDVIARNLGLTGQSAQEWVKQQTGTAPNDPDFEAIATVATFDQALSSALRISYSASTRRRTVNAGAILGSYLVADELHLFPRGQALTTLLCLLKARPPVPFLLMTATLTTTVASKLGELLDAEVYAEPLSAHDRSTLGVAERTRSVRWQAEPLTAKQIAQALKDHPEERILVVVNTVQRAIDLASKLDALLSRERLCVLHSRFYQKHRSAHEDAVMAAFGKANERSGEVRVAVATQVVEVGLDISADLIFTELAPASALVQRWGRSARWGGKAEIVVAPPSPDPAARIYPYVGEEDTAVIANTRVWLEANASGPAGLVMGADEERVLVEYAHFEADTRWADELSAALTARTAQVGDAIANGKYDLAGELIRHVDTRTVLICGKPDDLLKEPYGMEGFSLAPGSLMSLLPEKERRDRNGRIIEDDDEGEGSVISLDLPADAPWNLLYPVWARDVEDSEARANVAHHWEPATRRVDVTTQPVLAANPALVSYDDFFGLSLKAGETAVPEAFWARPAEGKRLPKSGHYTTRTHETYAEHIRRMLELYERHPALGPRVLRIAPTVEAWLGWPPNMLNNLIRAAIVVHDAGKLSPAWQAGIKAYQAAINRLCKTWPVHTDDPGGMPEPRWSQPHHALSGAAHSLEVGAALDALAYGREIARKAPLPSNVLFTAIATHHTPSIAFDNLWLSEAELLDPPAIAELNHLIVQWGLPGQASAPESRDLAHKRKVVDQFTITNSKNSREAFALALVIRMLRLADGWSQDEARREEVNVN